MLRDETSATEHRWLTASCVAAAVACFFNVLMENRQMKGAYSGSLRAKCVGASLLVVFTQVKTTLLPQCILLSSFLPDG